MTFNKISTLIILGQTAKIILWGANLLKLLNCIKFWFQFRFKSRLCLLNGFCFIRAQECLKFKVWIFWEAHIIWKKSSSWFWRLLSKSPYLPKPWERFLQIFCVSQKVRTLKTKPNVEKGKMSPEIIELKWDFKNGLAP